MAQPSSSPTIQKSSRDRAISSEPCSTRPNPFEDDNIPPKRRRTSLNSPPRRSRSVDTAAASSPDALLGAGHEPASGATSDSAMKIDSDSTPAQTPEKQILGPEPDPSSVVRSSRVTINVRTPSRLPLDAESSSPSGSPTSPLANKGVAESPGDAVKISIEESEVDMPRGDAAMDTPVSSTAGSGSPPVEVVTVIPDDEDEYEDPEPITILDDSADDSIQIDPTPTYPCRKELETWHEATLRISEHILHNTQVVREVYGWLNKYIRFTQSSSTSVVLRSYNEYQELWRSFSELVLYVAEKKPYSSNLYRNVRQDIMNFWKWIARLTALFVKLDNHNNVHHKSSSNQADRSLTPMSSKFVQALSLLNRRDEILHHTSAALSAGDDWSYANEASKVLDVFQSFIQDGGGTISAVMQLAYAEAQRLSQDSSLTEHISGLCALASQILHQIRRGVDSPVPQVSHNAKASIARAFRFFENMSPILTGLVDRNPGHITLEGAAYFIQSLSEIYQIALNIEGTVPVNVLTSHLQRHPQIPRHLVPDAITYIWKFSLFAKLIKSSQMQLRVMAVSNMCSDLVSIYRRYGDQVEDPNRPMMQFYGEFLIKTGLVKYILGPTCHPEVTVESANIIGFLAVSHTYEHEHTDALWQTVSTTPDPRVSEALLKLLKPILQLFQPEALLYFCSKLLTVPVSNFGMAMREFFSEIVKNLVRPAYHGTITDSAPYDLCIRLIRQSSAFGSQSPVAWLELQQLAVRKLKDLLQHGPGPEGRQRIALDCLDDLSRPSPSTIGSLWVLSSIIRPHVHREISVLVSEYNLARILVDELEGAIPRACAAGFPAVISGSHNEPRKDLLSLLISHEAASLTGELGARLWRLLVGSGAASKEDRDAGWQLLNSAMKRSQVVNNFTSACFSEYLPTLDPEDYCLGTLDFVRARIMPFVNDPLSIVLDDDESTDRAGIDMLWHMVLTAPKDTIEMQAIDTLVREVYMESRSILAFPHYRASKVHLALVGRCLQQLSSAAVKLRSFADGTASGDEDSMVLVATDQEVMKQELLFIRSLVVLREFHRLHQGKPEFSAPDLRALIGDSPKQVEGDSAELKFQSFDGDTQTAIKPLNIGRLNTAGSLLASLREATGFSNYRIYYRGKPFVPQESEICKSLEDLQIHNGIILVKKETEPVASPRTRPGASRLEAEILGHFEELWQYLSMEEKLAREMYLFLVKLPVDEHFLKSFETASVSYQDMFPMGQPFKSLYAVHALHSYLDSRPQDQAAETSPAEGDDASESSRASGASFARAMSLVVPALSDANVVARCSTFEMQIELGSALLKFFVFLLKDPRLPRTAGQFLDQQVLGRLLTLISTCFSADTSASVEEYVPLCLESILESCYVSEGFLSAFCHHPEVPNMVKRLLLLEHRDAIRQKAANLIRVACKLGEAEGDHSKPDSIALTLREVFWPIVSDLIRPAIISIGTSTELLSLSCALFNTLIRDGDDALDLAVLSREWFDLLLNYRTCEDVTKPHLVDDVASHLVSLLHVLMRAATIESDEESRHRILPSGDVAANIFWKHLYPVVDEKTAKKYASGNPVLTSPTRAMLQEIVLRLVKDDEEQFSRLIDDMYDLVQVDTSQELSDIYQYELLASTQFEREKAIRAECGYTGLRNLSNTCYFNSLYTQLFMNVDFRRFMLAATVDDTDSQSLLWNTKKTFAYLQNSIRRCISPEDCVASIRTYENGHIDINVQMDAEEFFNLLFDRWEGQFLTEQERNEFRSFYGGQLVHQVRSKECDHISESLEPFSAIQCVIKGKSTLHESLQAYVDGEILEDENKYKCSTCDKNVDAVKRTCIKEAPDNLIFHLKRFDYNVRTMQRFKINDWFSFPTMIDMRPYTVDFLDNPDQDHPEDLFELVGVLVHTGTTESGHYYSFVRERPGSDGKQTWVEFNDDVVSPWDPTHMEGSCFGGPEYQPFQNNATQFDKQNSAYMLFYQRTSSLARSQSLLRQSGLSSPLRVDVPKELEIHIHSDNNQILRRHCIYDTCQTEFVLKILSQLKSPSRGVCHEAHRKETTAMFMALGHLDQVTSRAKDTPNFARLVACLRGSCHSCARCSMALFKYFVEVPETFRMLVQRNPDPDVRKSAANLLIRALSVLRDVLSDQYGLNDDEDITADDNTSLLSGVMAIIDTLWANFPGHIRSWNEVFGFMLSFVKLGSAEVAVFLANRHLATLLWIIMADPAIEKMPNSIQRMLLALSRRQTARQPNYDSIIGLLDVLLAHVRLSDRDHKSRYGQYAYENHTRRTPVSEPPFDLLQEEGELLMLGWNHIKSNIFVEKLINIGQNPQSTDSIIANLIQQSFEMETLIYRTLRTAITGSVVAHTVGNYLRVAGGVFCRFASNRTLINELIKHTSAQCIGIQSTEGREFLEFQRQVFDGPRERSGETPHQVILAGLDVLPLWVPGLLAYQDTTVSEEVERFLHEKLFRQRTLPDPATEEGIMLAAQIKATGRALGSQCLIYLHDRHIKRNLEISERVVTLFQRVIKVCSRYFDIEDPEDMEASDFETNRKSVLDAVVRLAVADDLEEDGSDWENSSICSGQLDNVGGFTTI